MIDYETLIYRLGSLYVALLTADGAYDGERSIAVKAMDGSQRTVYVYIDGTDLQMSETPGAVIDFDVEAS